MGGVRQSLLSQMVGVVVAIVVGMAVTLAAPLFWSMYELHESRETCWREWRFHESRRLLQALEKVPLEKVHSHLSKLPSEVALVLLEEKRGALVLYRTTVEVYQLFRHSTEEGWTLRQGWWGRWIQLGEGRKGLLLLPRRQAFLISQAFFYALTTLLWVLLGGGIMIFVLYRLVLRPLEELLAANIGASQGQKEYFLIPEEVIPPNELGESMRQRNRLVQRLQQLNRELEEWNRKLELRVEEKTRELKKALEQLTQSEKLAALGKLASGIAHEVNNPLASIAGYAEALAMELEELDGLDEKIKRHFLEDLRTIEEQAYRLKELTRKLLNFARGGEVQSERVLLKELVEETVSLLMIKYRSSLPLEVLIPDDLWIWTDRGKVQQILMNLLDNAWHEVKEHGGKIQVVVRKEGEDLWIGVRDEGRGIPEELKRRIFEPFFSTKPVGQGTGLGLFVSFGLAEQLGGTLEVESVQGRGSLFWLYLPKVVEEETEPEHIRVGDERVPEG